MLVALEASGLCSPFGSDQPALIPEMDIRLHGEMVTSQLKIVGVLGCTP